MNIISIYCWDPNEIGGSWNKGCVAKDYLDGIIVQDLIRYHNLSTKISILLKYELKLKMSMYKVRYHMIRELAEVV